MEAIYQVSLIGSMLVGFGLMAYAVIVSRKQDEEGGDHGYSQARELYFGDASANEIAKTVGEFEEISNYIFEEMEGKHNELLELYALIDKKKKELDELHTVKPVHRRAEEEAASTIISDGEAANSALSTINIRKARRLQEDGLSVDDIAENLGVGKKEVKFMLDLSKIR